MANVKTIHRSRAQKMLQAAIDIQTDRGRIYGNAERSMPTVVAAFNAATGHNLSEVDGWQFMEILKLVRSRSGEFHADNFIDGASYASLAGEAAERAAGYDQEDSGE